MNINMIPCNIQIKRTTKKEQLKTISMKKIRQAVVFLLPLTLMYTCVRRKEMTAQQEKFKQLDSAYLQAQNQLRDCKNSLNNQTKEVKDFSKEQAAYESRIKDLNSQLDFLKQNNNAVLNNLKDLSVISDAQAQSIRKSLDNIGAKDMYINDLRSSMARKDSLNMALVNNLKSALVDINDQDINIKVDKDVVYVDISDKLLFKSGSYDVTEKAKVVLGKVARVLNAHPDIEFLVEGNTDANPYKNNQLLDNWDLSVKRATSVTRILQHNYNIDPKRITAAGRGEYVPVASNSTAEGRAANRRTRIVILPQLDQFFKLLEKK